MKIQNGDRVKVCKGADKGKEGEILRILRNNRVIISGVNIRTLHKKPKTGEEKGSIEKKEMPVNLSNMMLIDPESKKQTRIGYIGTSREKKRITRKSDTILKKNVKKRKDTKDTKDTKEEKTQP